MGGPSVWPTRSPAISGRWAARIETGHRVESLAELDGLGPALLDVTPRQLTRLADGRLPSGYARRLERFRYGPGVFKLDWALDGPIPWRAPEVARAGTVHLGGTLEEIAASEEAAVHGRHHERPFVLLVQPTRFDPTRAPAGKHTAWAYCHVPHGSPRDMTEAIEAQVERFAPGFRDLIIGRSAMGPAAMERHNPNYIGGDINGGVQDLRQLVHPTRGPARPLRDAPGRRTPLLVVDPTGRRRARHVRLLGRPVGAAPIRWLRSVDLDTPAARPSRRATRSPKSRWSSSGSEERATAYRDPCARRRTPVPPRD